MPTLPRVHVRALLFVIAAVSLCASALFASPVSAAPKGPSSGELRLASGGDGYTALSPARLLDTRPGTATIDGQFVGGGAVERFLDLTIAGRGGVPSSGATAVALNVTVTAPTASSYLTAWPTGEPQPNASNLNSSPNQTIANSVIVKLGVDGKVSFFNELGTTHLIVDVVGWFATASDFTPRVPARILDTRPDGTTIDGQGRSEEPFTPRRILLPVAGRADVPSSATAVVLNVTIVAPTQNAFATVWPGGTAKPNASNLNYEVGRNVANQVVSSISETGAVLIEYSAGSAYVLADVVGWFGIADDYNALQPARLLDTRSPGATIDGAASGEGALGAGGIIDLVVAGRGGVPSVGADAVVVNVTATQPTSGSFVTVWPSDGGNPPNASTLNVVAERTVPNLAIVRLGPDGRISLFNEQGATHLIVDVVGWFPSSLDFNATVLEPGIVGTFFSQTFGARSAIGAPAFGFLDTAPGLSGSASGVVSGTPTVAGTYSTLGAVADESGSTGVRFFPHHIFSAADGYIPVSRSTIAETFSTAGRVASNTNRSITVAGVGAVPADALGVVLNVHAESDAAAFLTVYRAGTAMPDAASVNLPGGEADNVLVVPVGTGGGLTVTNIGAADYQIEVLGYFGVTSAYNAVTPMRLADTRNGIGIVGTPITPGTTRTVQVSGGPLPSLRSVVLNVTVTGASAAGSLDIAPAGGPFQAPTTLDFGTQTYGQTVIVPVSAGGAIDIRNRAGGQADVIVDVWGYFEP